MPFLRFAVAVLLSAICSVTAAHAAGQCSSKMQPMRGGSILATMSYWARPGKADALYRGVVTQNDWLARHGVRQYTIYRASGSNGPSVVWAMIFPSFKAHNAWLDATNRIHESPTDMANDKQLDAATLRVVHSHYVLHDAWSQTPCP
jgi:hypothetical protein